MKKILKKLTVVMLAVFMFVGSVSYTNNAQAAEKEMRAAWVSTVYNLDWPKTKNNASKQKQELTQLMDKLKGCGINTIVLQVRPESDALYKSSINPWSKYLTGTQGKDPGYDPLAFAVQEAHKRGMELHAWMNPYRVTSSGTNLNALVSSHPARKNPSWVIKYNGKMYYDPGNPAVVDYLVKTVKEVVDKYDVDGIHFDDYFYPSSSFPDDTSYQVYGKGQDRNNWRRENVNTLLKRVKAVVNARSGCEFGVSPFGIWRNKSADCPDGSETSGSQSYYNMLADSRTWIRKGYVDYIVPQIYWPIGLKVADYSKLVKWWANEVKGYDVDLYIGQGIYKQGQSSHGGQNIAKEIKNQIKINKQYSTVKGSMYFSARDIVNNAGIYNDLKSMYGAYNGTIEDKNLPTSTEIIGANRYDTAAKISKKGWNASSTVVIANGLNEIEGIVSNPLASAYNAPVLLAEKDKVSKYTTDELKRLSPSNIIIIGDKSSIGENTVSNIKKVAPSASIKRIEGSNIEELSVNIAKEIDSKANVSKIYVAGENGAADALSVVSKAAEEKAPIIVTSKNSVNSSVKNWIKSNSISSAYFLGENAVISNNVIKEIDSVVLG
ncbi:MAG: family 10 glycosylhydrolase, partial [Peptacetobacter hiranonis]|nr:family 10 glycosylhydrolase [Peptacetobacter hiranonis]